MSMGAVPDDGEVGLLLQRARAWAAEDPRPSDSHTVQLLAFRVEDGDEEALAELRELFGAPLGLGPDGLRGVLGPGSGRVNRAVIRQVAAGVAGWVRAGDARGGVVVGRDARYGSEVFAIEVVEVLAGHGLAVYVLPDLVPTPVLAYAVGHLGAAAGVMVTGGDGPPRENGCRVYDGAGRPLDRGQVEAVTAQMEAAGPLSQVPVSGSANPLIRRIPLEVVDEYITEVLATVVRSRLDRAPVQVAYTPLHGVAGPTVRRACRQSGFITLHEVPEQADPDPELPTVPLPDPGQPGALDKLRGQAAWAGADVALANDPDAAGLAMAVHDPERGPVRDAEAWRTISGDELGWLLADHLVRRGSLPPDGLFATTVTSSTLLQKLAVEADVAQAQTLPGLPSVVRAAEPDRRLVFGHQPPHGYCLGDLVRDADGVGALLLAAEVVSDLVAAGLTVLDRLDDLARRFGVHRTGRWSCRPPGWDGGDRVAEAMAGLRAAPPGELAGRRVVGVADLRDGPVRPGLDRADVVGLALEGARVVIRPGDVGPELICDVEVVEPLPDGDLAAARSRADEALDAILAALPATLDLDLT